MATMTIPPVSNQVSTFAGSGKVGDRDGLADSAQFVFVMGIAFDQTGNLYVADNTNDLLRKISPGRLVTTVAGSGFSMYRHDPVDGKGRNASFSLIQGLVVDPSGNCYIVERSQFVRKVTPDGQVSTFAVLPYYGNGITIDQTGNLFVASSACSIYKITPGGTVSLFAGQPGIPRGFKDGSVDSARFVDPVSLAFDKAGNLFVGDAGEIRKVSIDGSVITVAGGDVLGSLDGTGKSARFNQTSALAFDDKGDLYIADYSAIRKLTPNGQVTTVTGGSPTSGLVDGSLAAALFDNLTGLAFDKAGKLYVADRNNRRIRKIVLN